MAATAATDTDGDGLRDTFEVRWGVSDPRDPDSDGDGVVDPAEDGDGDRLGDLGEQRFGTNPAAPDSDGDGRSDGREDSDGDGRSDALEQDQRPLPAGLRPTLAKAPRDIWPRQEECGGPRWGSTRPVRCWFGDAASPVTMAVVGDFEGDDVHAGLRRCGSPARLAGGDPPQGDLLTRPSDHQHPAVRRGRRSIL